MENKPIRGGHRGHRGYHNRGRQRGGRFAHQPRFHPNNTNSYNEGSKLDDGLVYPKKYSRAARHKTKLCTSYEDNGECKFGDK